MGASRKTVFGGAFALIAGVFAFAMAGISDASATHFRGGSISWTTGATENEIIFTVTSYYRRSYGVSAFREFANPDNNKLPGDTLTYQSLNVGGQSYALNHTVTGVNIDSDWMGMTATVTHTYTNLTEGDTFTAFLTSCCRISSLRNSRDTTYRLQTWGEIGTGSSPDVGSTSPIFLVPDEDVVVFNPFNATDPDGGLLTYALATAAEAGSSYAPPPGLSIDAITGDVTWDMTALNPAHTSPGNLWTVSFLVTDSDGNVAPLEILLSMCEPGTAGCGDFEPPDPQISEPATLAAFGLGLMGLALQMRRRRRKS